MEDVVKIERFLQPDRDYGFGDGNAVGYGNSYGDCKCICYGVPGYGSEYGYSYCCSGSDSGFYYSSDGNTDGAGIGAGDGTGSGDNRGSGESRPVIGDGLKTYNGHNVYYIDGIPTLIYNIIGSYAQCAIIQNDLTLKPCYVAKVADSYAHGESVREAMMYAYEKYNENKPIEQRIADFMQCAPSLDSVCDNKWLFSEHHILTGSCLMGRKQFVKEHEIDVEHGKMTVASFIELTENAYGSDAILQLLKAYKNK